MINEQKEVLSIVAPRIGDGPFNLVIDEDLSFDQYLTAESSIMLHKNEIIIGKLQIDLQNAQYWDPCPKWKELHVRRTEIVQRLAQAKIPDHQPAVPVSLLSQLSSAFALADISTALALVPKIAGLGNGLTPAGDDFLMGAMHAAWIIHSPDIATSLTSEITTAAAPLTTSLSAAWLKSAARGEAGILWHEFFDALISGNTEDIQNAMNKILAVGETSGADALAGFLDLLKR